MASRKELSEQLNAALAVSIKAQPVSTVEAAIAELRTAGLDKDADDLAKVLAAREQELAAARGAKEREEAAAHQAAVDAARADFAAKAEAYVEVRDEALDSLAVYVQKAQPGMDAYKEMQAAAAALDRLTGLMVERPETASSIVASDERFRPIRRVNFNSRPL